MRSTRSSNDLAKIFGKFRRCTIDRKDQIFAELAALVKTMYVEEKWIIRIQTTRCQQNEAQQPENATAQPTAEQGADQTEQKQPTSYAVRPIAKRPLPPIGLHSDQNNMLKVRNYLNIAFMLLAIVGVILWTQLEESRNIAYIVLIVGVVLKIAEVCIRLFKK